jgi:signal transduction histidine kinase
MNTKLNFSDLKRILNLLEGSNMLCFIKSNQKGQIKFLNEAASKLFEIPNLLNHEMKDLFADSNDWIDLEHQLAKEYQLKDSHYLLKSTSNRNYWTAISAEFADDDMIYWVLKDISSALKQKQELDHQRALLEKSQTEMDRIIYSASHDLRAPISSILGLLNLLNLAHTDQEKNEYMFMIQSSVIKLDSIVQNLGQISKNSNEVVRDEKIDFNMMFNLVKDELSFHPHFAAITLEKTLTQKYLFYSDFQRVKLLLYNILKNCFDFIDNNKSQNLVDVEFICSAEKVNIKIFDNGIGVSKGNIDKIFNLFYRGSDRSKGSGLGLFESKEIVVRLGGQINLNSEYTLGTSIEIEIPNSKKGKLINKKNELRG